MDHLDSKQLDILAHMLERSLINQVNTITALELMQNEIDIAIMRRRERAKSCGLSDDCLKCYKFSRCVRERAEKKALDYAQQGRLSYDSKD